MATSVLNLRFVKGGVCDALIDRRSPWGNPFKDGTREQNIAAHREWIGRQPAMIQRARRELRDKELGCWCAPMRCHGDTLAEIADSEPREHTWFKCPAGCSTPYCQFCEGGLGLCTGCKGFEGSLPYECPGFALTELTLDLIYTARLDFTLGRFVVTLPAAWEEVRPNPREAEALSMAAAINRTLEML